MQLVTPESGADRKSPLSLYPSEWAMFALRIPRKGKLRRFTFKNREFLIPIYDRADKKVLLMFGRQSEKSTTVGNKLLSLASMLHFYKILYVNPSQLQTRTFSQDRIAQPRILSPVLNDMLGEADPDNVHEKVFLRNQSSIRLRYAYLNPDRIRGIPTDFLALDELQDIISDSIHVIEECLTHSDHPTHRAWEMMSGTPKSLDNTLTSYWMKSTQSELFIPCEAHGTPNRPGSWYWQSIGEKNLGRHGLICDRCGKPLNRFHPSRGWIDTVPGKSFRGYRLPQPLSPAVQDDEWEEKILWKYENYPRAKFFNEVLALPWEAGIRPLTKGEILACCNPNWRMSPEQMREALKWRASREIFAGVDFGTGEKSWTVVALGAYTEPTKFEIFYLHRFTGVETTPSVQGKLLVELFDRFGVHVSFGDYGMGIEQNDTIQRARGPRKHHILQYVASAKRKIYYNKMKGRWMGERDDLIGAVVNAVKTRKIRFPAWEAFEPFGMDMLNVTAEFNEARQRTVFDHPAGKPDDTFHAIVYCLIASALITPRPDIFMSLERPVSLG